MKEFIETAENLIRSGQFDEVEKCLQKLGKIERKHAVAVANIARRVNRLNLAVKILHPIVRPTDDLQAPATAQEKVEYADVLRQLGALKEAWDLLSEINPEEFPKVLFHQALCLFNQWKYSETLPILKKYVQVATLTPYERIVGQVNLAAALIQQGHSDEASRLLDLLKEETQKSGALLMYGSSLELSAQIAIFKGDFEKALSLLEESCEVLKRTGRVVSLYVQKWTAIARCLKDSEVHAELQDVFAKAQSLKHWETVRDCELYQAYLQKDSAKFLKLYFGTPYESFRQRILQFAGADFQVPESYVNSNSTQVSLVLDLASGKYQGKRMGQLPLGHAIHRFLILLSQDFYKPLPVMNAFGKLFPDEYMNATTSANRVHQIVKRCREWIEENSLPMKILEEDSSYRLVLGDGMGLLLPSQALPTSSQEIVWSLLKRAVGSEAFSCQRASEILSCSPSNAKLLLRWALEQGHLQKLGKSSQTAYQIVSSSRRAVV